MIDDARGTEACGLSLPRLHEKRLTKGGSGARPLRALSVLAEAARSEGAPSMRAVETAPNDLA